MRIIVTGTRESLTLQQRVVVLDALREACKGERDVVIVHGANSNGVDAYVDSLCIDLHVPVERHRAKWKLNGRAAGPARNAEMVREGADLCLAFPKGASPGTRNCMRQAADAGIEVKVIEL